MYDFRPVGHVVGRLIFVLGASMLAPLLLDDWDGNMLIDAQAASRFEPGSRVFHQKFGYGLIREIEGDKLTVAFEKAGEKKVVASYVTEARKPGGADDVPF